MSRFAVPSAVLLLVAVVAEGQVPRPPIGRPIRPLPPIRPGIGIVGEAPKPMPLEECLDKIKAKETRLQAIIALADHGAKAEPALDHLLEALQTSDEDLRLNAAITLAKIGKAAVPPVVNLASADKDDVRFYAVWTLGWIGPEAKGAAATLVRAMADKNDEVRRKAAYALGRVAPDPESALPVLLTALEDKNPEVRGAAAEATARFGVKAVPGLVKILETSGSVEAKQAATTALGEIGAEAKAAIPILRKSMLETPGAAPQAAATLGKFGKEAVPALLEGINTGEASLTSVCLQALGAMGADAAPTLVDLLGHKNAEVRLKSAQQLAPMRIGDKMVVLGLAYALNDTDPGVRYAAINGLQILGPAGKLAAPKVGELLQDLDPNLRQQAFYLLQNMGEDPRPMLKQALASVNPSVVIATAGLMVRVGLERDQALPILREALTAKDSDIRISAAVTLAMTRTDLDKVAPILVEGLRHKNPGLRQASLQGLQYVSPKNAKDVVPALIAMLNDKDTQNHAQVIYMLRAMRADLEQLIPALARLVDDSNHGTRQAVIQTLIQVGGTGPDIVMDLYKRTKDANTRVQVLSMLIYSPQRAKAMSLMLEAAQDPDASVRANVMHMVPNLGNRNDESLILLTKGLKDDNLLVRSAAASGLYVFNGNAAMATKAASVLEEQIKSEKEVQPRRAMVQSMFNLWRFSKTSPDTLTACLKDSDPQVRWTAAQVLGQMGAQAKDAIPTLESMQKDADPTVRQVVSNVLNQLQSLRKK